MSYVPDWEALAHAMKRLLEAGRSLDEAKAGLVWAIADRKIRIRFEIGESLPPSLFELGEIRLGKDVKIPVHLTVDDFDWDVFCPTDWWPSAHSTIIKYKFKWVDVWRQDVTRILLQAPSSGLSVPAAASEEEIRVALRQVYNASATRREKAPNINEVVAPVKALLRAIKLTATKEQIQERASENEFSQLRRPAGPTVTNERSKRS